MSLIGFGSVVAGLPLVGLPVLLLGAVGGGPEAPAAPAGCAATSPDGGPAYYSFRLLPAGNLRGSQRVIGQVTVSFEPSPFDVTLSRDGHFRYDLRVTVEGLAPPGAQEYVVWVAPPKLDPVRPLAVLDSELQATGTVELNKFLLFVTREPAGDGPRERWSGPILLKGLSRSALMQSMAGHGFFEQEPC